MSKMKKVLLLCTAYVLVAALAIGGTVAYLQHSDSDVNTMTMGNVKIAQHEYERVVDENGKWVPSTFVNYGYTADKMQKFTQAKPAYPAVYQDGDVKWDDRKGSQDASGATSHQQPWNQIGAPGSNQLFDDSVKNVIDKFVFVENTGSSTAYFRTLIAIEWPEELDMGLLHTNMNANSLYEKSKIGFAEIGGVNYILYDMTHKEPLSPDEISRPSLLQVFLDPLATNENCELFGDTWEILVLSQAAQTAGFGSAQSALDAAFGEVTAANAAKWFASVKAPVVLTDANTVHESTVNSGMNILGNNITTSGDANDSSGGDRYGYGYEYIIRKGADYTLDLNGKTINHRAVNKNTNNNALTYLFVANNAGTKLTINGEGNIYCKNSEGYTCAVQGKDGTLITINGGDYNVDNGIAVWAGAGAHIVINGGSFVNGNATTDHELIYSSGGVIDIYGGFFHNTDGNYTLNVEDRNRATGFINVYGGTYVNFDPSTGSQDPNNIKVAEGYKVVSETKANGDVWYTVVAE